MISVLCLTIGTFALLEFGMVATAARARGVDLSAVNIGGFAESSYPFAIAGFAVQGALIQCAMRGFTRWRMILLVISSSVLTSVNLARTAFVLPTILAFLLPVQASQAFHPSEMGNPDPSFRVNVVRI